MSARQAVSGWGRYPVTEATLHRPSDQRSARGTAARLGPYVARGLGRSYADPALNKDGDLLLTPGLDRFLSWDGEAGVLECEAGVSLAAIIDRFLPEGWFLSVSPGTKFVTVGGAIAANVHGKNHHRDGAFAEFLLDFRLLTPLGDVLLCTRTQNPDVFWATVGGMGLTGVILSARFRLKRLSSAYFAVEERKARDLDHALDIFEATVDDFPYSMAWTDCMAQGKRLGRSVVWQGDSADPDSLKGKRAREPFGRVIPKRPGVPVDAPGFALAPWTMRPFNATIYHTHRDRDLVTPLDTYFYPLDAIHDWNRLYGKRGFVQYQFVLPHDTARDGIRDILGRLAARGAASFLAVLKRFGDGDDGFLSFPRPGITLALDIPMRKGLVPFLQDLDTRVLDYGGRTYLAKDAVMQPETFEAMYPRHKEFRRIRERLDPDGRLVSDQARRIGLVA